MDQQSFVNQFLPYAQEMEGKYKVPALSALSQSALETGYGEHTPGNMMFGIKAGTNWTGKRQLLQTTEYHTTNTVAYPVIFAVDKVNDNLFKYTVKDWFRAYDSPKDSFEDYAKLLSTSPTYASAFNYTDPYLFTRQVAKSYATDPTYYQKLSMIITDLKKKVLPSDSQD